LYSTTPDSQAFSLVDRLHPVKLYSGYVDFSGKSPKNERRISRKHPMTSVVEVFKKFRWGQAILRPVWNKGKPRRYDRAVALGLIDPRIAGLVAKLNVPGIVSTYACCEGHWLSDGVRLPRDEFPYVGFRADIDFAAALNRALTEVSPSAGGRLQYHWIVEYGFGFVLRPHVSEALGLGRAVTDRDFAVIGDLVDDVVLSIRGRSGHFRSPLEQAIA
jgi:hypothetical protein